MSIDNQRQHGFSLIELMIGITLGLLILAGLATVFVNNLQTRNDIERANQQSENGRYAAQVITDDLRLAGYLAALDPFSLPTPATKPDPCATDLLTLRQSLPLAVQGYDNALSATLSCLDGLIDGTDILVVRRASSCAVGSIGCDPEITINPPPYLQASMCSSATELGSLNPGGIDFFRLNTNTSATTLDRRDNTCNPPVTVGAIAPYYQYLVRIYFIAAYDKPGDGIPTLKRAELTGGASANVKCSPNSAAPPCFSIVSLVQGIENMQIEYGIDTAGALTTPAPTGTPSVYTANPDAYSSCSSTTSPTCTAYWRNVVAAKISLLARSTTKTAGYDDSKKTYLMGLKADGTTPNTVTPIANDEYKRHLYQSVVRLNNISGRNTP